MADLYKFWEDKNVLPVVTVEYSTGRVLMLGYMNKEAFAYTLKTHRAYYCSAQGEDIRKFGDEIGNVQKVMSIETDCENKSLLMHVIQRGHVCHHNGKHSTCFNEALYRRSGAEFSKRRKFGRVEVAEDFDYSKEDYEDELE